ncbi:Type IV secretion protein Rhs, protein [Aphelenchoides bicaudatus]|nr:Type IV secretion protein Rhs, protein [Aphelenchoides bicaudatus]
MDSTQNGKFTWMLKYAVWTCGVEQEETINLTVKKDLTRFYKACGCDEAGHAIGNEVGGPPTEENLFPQNRNLNTGHWKTVSNKLSTHLDVPTDDRHAAVEMAFSFTDRFHQNRPDSFAYRFTLFTTRDGYMANNGPSRNVEKVIYGKFLNEDHTHTDLMGCADGNQELYWAEIADQRFYGRQSCDIDRFYYPIYGRPQPAG